MKRIVGRLMLLGALPLYTDASWPIAGLGSLNAGFAETLALCLVASVIGTVPSAVLLVYGLIWAFEE